MFPSTSSAFAVPSSKMLCVSCAPTLGRPIASKTATVDRQCRKCGTMIRVGSSFAWAEAWNPSMGGGKRRGGSSAPSMVTQAPAPTFPTLPTAPTAPTAPVLPPTVTAPTVATPATVEPSETHETTAPAAADLDLMISIARKAAKDAAAGVLGSLSARIDAVDAKASGMPNVTIVHAWNPAGEAEGPAPTTAIGPVHKDFPRLVRLARAALASGSHLWIYGGAGWGKTHHVALLAKVLGLPYYAEGSIADRFIQLLGYKRPTDGVYEKPQFVQAFEGGGICNLDEIDRSTDPGTPLAINMALSAPRAAFPCGIVERHASFLMVGCANTDGSGATADYTGAIRFDAAFLDRTCKMRWNEDEALETALYPTAAPAVQYLRARARDRGIKALITMRASAKVAALIAMGETTDAACAEIIGEIMTPDQYRSIAA